MTTTAPPPIAEAAAPESVSAGQDDGHHVVSDGGGAVLDLGDLTREEHDEILDAVGVMLRIYQGAARRTLQDERPAAETGLALAELRAAESLENARPYQETITRLETELTDCQKYAAGLAAASDGDDFRARIKASAEQTAAETEVQAIHGQLQDAQRAAEPYLNNLRQATADQDRDRADLADLDYAIRYPFISRRGQNTGWWQKYLLRSGQWADRDSRTSRAIVDKFLKDTKYGAHLQMEAVHAYIAGDLPGIGGVKHLPDGSTVYTLGDVPIVVQGAATPGDLAGVPPVQTSWPSGADADAGLRSGAAQGPPPATITKTATTQELRVTIPSAITRAIAGR